MTIALTPGQRHLAALERALRDLDEQTPRIERWGVELARALAAGGRLLAAGNGGSAAQAQHLTAELVGRYRDERMPLSAIALCAEPSALSAIANDYGVEEVFARQVRAHGRRGDVLIALSTSGGSANVLAAVDCAERIGMRTWALTGPGGNALTDRAQESVTVAAAGTATVQEAHLVAIHLLCGAVDAELARPARLRRTVPA
jgi:D-sedoheptulose 7-phosphate isomerase